MFRAASLLPLLALLALSIPASGAPLPARPIPKNLRELGERLDDLALRLQHIVEEANKDPDAARIKLYREYKPEEMKKTRGRVRAEDLVEWMLDPTKHFVNVRQAAATALHEGALYRGDPELSQTEKVGSRSRRAYFSEKYLVKNLDHDDRLSRGLVHDLLKKLWGRTGVPEIERYNPSNEKTWRPAIKKWRQYLKRH